jgi:hypothetical protein
MGKDAMTNTTSYADFCDVVELAQFCAELMRQGIKFRVVGDGPHYTVYMTGY